MKDVLLLKDIPASERPRERLVRLGAQALSNSELLAILLGTGSHGEPVQMLSTKIIAQYPLFSDLAKLHFSDLHEIRGIGIAKACLLSAVFEMGRRIASAPQKAPIHVASPQEVFQLVRPYFIGKSNEHFLVMSLDARKKLIAIDTVTIGIVDQVLVHPREVFKTAFDRRASYVILAHNHPSNDATPSEEDIVMTKRLQTVSYTMGIPLLHHLIVTDYSYALVLTDA